MTVSHRLPAREPRSGSGPGVDDLTDLPIAFLGTYPPRLCGIASFTRDLAAATALDRRVSPMILAVTDPGGQYEYPPEVRYEVRQGVKADYARAAEFVNYSKVRLVSVQHEFGIFGGEQGSYLLEFLAALRVPAVATLHTVLGRPSDRQRAIIQQLAKRCAGLVVMSDVARDLLESAHGVSGPKVRKIPHGIPELRPRDQGALKAGFGVAGRPMLLTFGLLGPGKGIETVVRALPKVLAEFPDVVYFVVGATHPTVLARDGEAYRTMLEREAEALGVREHVVFRNQFVTSEELGDYLQAADIFVSPYLGEAQVTSGALSYAMGAGLAVVSTPYWHAKEILEAGRGRLFPFENHEALGRTLVELLGSPGELARLRAGASAFARDLVWPRVGEAHVALARDALNLARVLPAVPAAERPTALPELRLDHLLRLTDDTGIIQHATYSVPARNSGYCVDDNARALIVALQADHFEGSRQARRLVTTYLSYLQHAQREDGAFDNFMSYARIVEGNGALSDDCLGRAVWALGTTVRMAGDEGCRLLAREMLRRSLPRTRDLGPRGTALSLLGVFQLLAVDPDAPGARASLDTLEERLVRRYQDEAADGWLWFEPTLTYDNAMLPLALFTAYRVTSRRTTLRIARESLEFLESLCFQDGQLLLVGNSGWHAKGGEKPVADEQAIDATAFVLAYRSAYLATGDHQYLVRMRAAFAWFLGKNRLGLPVYDFATGGCRDGLGTSRLNENEGAESTISFLLALQGMLELAEEGLEHGGLDLAGHAKA